MENFMSITRRIDKLGRITIPIDYREKFNLSENAPIRITCEENGIIISPTASACKICGAFIKPNSKFPICQECIKAIKDSDK